jgi:hypothetical protein
MRIARPTRCRARSSWWAAGEVGVGELEAVDDAAVAEAGAQLVVVVHVLVDAQDAEEAARDVEVVVELVVGVPGERAGEGEQVERRERGRWPRAANEAARRRRWRPMASTTASTQAADQRQRQLPQVGEHVGARRCR